MDTNFKQVKTEVFILVKVWFFIVQSLRAKRSVVKQSFNLQEIKRLLPPDESELAMTMNTEILKLNEYK